MQEKQQLDFLCVYVKMKADNVFEYVVADQEMILNLKFNFNKDPDESSSTTHINNALEDLMSNSNIIKKLSKTQDVYATHLKEYLGELFILLTVKTRESDVFKIRTSDKKWSLLINSRWSE